MKDKICCGIYDFDGVLVPGEELMDNDVHAICKEASNAYCEDLFKQQTKLIGIQQQLEQERDIYGYEMQEVQKELEEINKKIKNHFKLKDQVLEETEPEYKNRINYREIYKKENIYLGVLELLWQIYESKIYEQLIVNTHVNSEREIIAKKDLLQKDFPPMRFIPVKYHILPYRDPFDGMINNNRKPSDKIGRLVNISNYIDVNLSTFIDNTASIIKRGRELGLNCYYVEKNHDIYIEKYPILNTIPGQVIMEAANDTIDRVHDGKIKKLSL